MHTYQCNITYLVVEVRHDHLETLVLLADQVLYRDLDVFEGDVGGTARPYTLAVHSSRRNTASFALNEEHGNSVHALIACSYCSGEVVAPDTVRDPLLLAVDDVVFAVFGKLSFAGEVRNVATGI